MMHFVRTFLIMRAQGVRHIAMKEVGNCGKNVYNTSKAFLKMAGGKMHIPLILILPLDPPLAISDRNP